jgi:hypothetical protein
LDGANAADRWTADGSAGGLSTPALDDVRTPLGAVSRAEDRAGSKSSTTFAGLLAGAKASSAGRMARLDAGRPRRPRDTRRALVPGAAPTGTLGTLTTVSARNSRISRAFGRADGSLANIRLTITFSS